MLAAAVVCASAQSKTGTVNGAVVDPNGNPLPGAVVSATGGAETTIVESDGTFSLEVPVYLKSLTASYPGYKDNKKKTDFSKEMLFTLSPKTSQTFINLAMGYSFSYDDSSPMVGLMIGKLATWGFYGKLLLPTSWKGMSTGNMLADMHVTFGAIRKIVKNVYVYLGAGYTGIPYWDYNDWDYDWDDEAIEGYSFAGMGLEGGFIFGIGKHFDITAGYTFGTDFDGWNTNTINISLGYKF